MYPTSNGITAVRWQRAEALAQHADFYQEAPTRGGGVARHLSHHFHSQASRTNYTKAHVQLLSGKHL